jgi:hypothetical protein
MMGTFGFGYRFGEVPMMPFPKLDPSAKVSVRRVMVERMPMSVDLGMSIRGFAPPHVDVNDPRTVEHGLCCRFLSEVPQLRRQERLELRSFVRIFLKKFLKPLDVGDIPSVDEYVEGLNQPCWRKAELLRSYYDSEWLGTTPLTWRINSFGKREFYEDYKPLRWINSRDDYTKVYYGPFMHALEKVVFDLPWFIKHVPVSERPEALKKKLFKAGAVYIQTDYSKFEKHFSPSLIRSVEGQLYKWMLQRFPGVADSYVNMISGVQKCKHKYVKAQVLGKRMSGDLVTSVGNGFTNLMLMLYIAYKKTGRIWNGVVEGDDGLFTEEGEGVCSKDFEDLGFSIKLVKHYSFSSASFCGILSEEQALQTIRDPRWLLCKFGWSHSQRLRGGRRVLLGLLRAKCFSCLYELPSCPIVTAFARRGLELTTGYEPIFDESWWEREQRKMWGKLEFPPITLATRQMVSELYGISIQCQMRVEKVISTLQLEFCGHPEICDLLASHEKANVWMDYYDRFVGA